MAPLQSPDAFVKTPDLVHQDADEDSLEEVDVTHRRLRAARRSWRSSRTAWANIAQKRRKTQPQIFRRTERTAKTLRVASIGSDPPGAAGEQEPAKEHQ
jgi:hypothetical protein